MSHLVWFDGSLGNAGGPHGVYGQHLVECLTGDLGISGAAGGTRGGGGRSNSCESCCIVCWGGVLMHQGHGGDVARVNHTQGAEEVTQVFVELAQDADGEGWDGLEQAKDWDARVTAKKGSGNKKHGDARVALMQVQQLE
jgi:hypothetical protein